MGSVVVREPAGDGQAVVAVLPVVSALLGDHGVDGDLQAQVLPPLLLVEGGLCLRGGAVAAVDGELAVELIQSDAQLFQGGVQVLLRLGHIAVGGVQVAVLGVEGLLERGGVIAIDSGSGKAGHGHVLILEHSVDQGLLVKAKGQSTAQVHVGEELVLAVDHHVEGGAVGVRGDIVAIGFRLGAPARR